MLQEAGGTVQPSPRFVVAGGLLGNSRLGSALGFEVLLSVNQGMQGARHGGHSSFCCDEE